MQFSAYGPSSRRPPGRTVRWSEHQPSHSHRHLGHRIVRLRRTSVPGAVRVHLQRARDLPLPLHDPQQHRRRGRCPACDPRRPPDRCRSGRRPRRVRRSQRKPFESAFASSGAPTGLTSRRSRRLARDDLAAPGAVRRRLNRRDRREVRPVLARHSMRTRSRTFCAETCELDAFADGDAAVGSGPRMTRRTSISPTMLGWMVQW